MADAPHAQVLPPRKRVLVPRGSVTPQALVSRLGELASKTKPHNASDSRSLGASESRLFSYLGASVLGRGAELALSPRGVVPSQSSSVDAASSTLRPAFEDQQDLRKDAILPVLNDLNRSEHKPIATVHQGKNKSKRLSVRAAAQGQALPTLLESDGDGGNDHGSPSPRNRSAAAAAAAAERSARLQACFATSIDEAFDTAAWFRQRVTHKANAEVEKKVVRRFSEAVAKNRKALGLSYELGEDYDEEEIPRIVPGLTEAKSVMMQLELWPKEKEEVTVAPQTGQLGPTGDEERPELPRQSDTDEIRLAVETINLYRFLCGLQPVELDEKCGQACDGLCEIFRPHEPMLIPPTHYKKRMFESCSEQLSTMLGRNCQHFAIIQGAATLTGMVQEGLSARLCSNGDREVDTNKTSRPPHEHLKTKIRELAAQKTAKTAHELAAQRTAKKHGHTRIQAQQEDEVGTEATMQPRVVDPEGLDLGLLWGLATNLEPTCCTDRSFSRASTVTVSSRRSRASRRRAEAASDILGDCSFWGDASGALGFRRLVLDPALERVGMGRVDDVGVVWTLPVLDAILAIDQDIPPPLETRQIPDVTCFPPAGVVPMELFLDASAPWTIMPSNQRFQPTAGTKVKMWRVQINKPPEDAIPASRAKGWSADRIEEIPITQCAVDCSARGNAFCVIFWPKPFCGVCSGDQYEVVLSGLTGERAELRFFHEFVATGQAENALLAEAKQLFQGKLSLGNPKLWDTPTFFDETTKLKIPQRMSLRLLPDEVSTSLNSPGRGSACRFSESSPLKPVSHPAKQMTIDSPQMAMAFEGTNITVLQAILNYCRVDGTLSEIPRSTVVHRIGSRFVVLLRFPFLAGAWYQLSFKMATQGQPTLEDSTVKYLFKAVDKVASIVPSFNHPLMDKFGFPLLDVFNTQSFGAMVLAPRTFRVFEELTYFLVYLDRAVPRNQGDEKGKKVQPQILRKLLESDPKPNNKGDPEASIDGLAIIHNEVAKSLRSQVQVTAGTAHVDLSINGGQHVKQLLPRGDFPCLYEGFLELGAEHLHTSIELFLRYPQSDAEWAPRKLAEWRVVKPEHFPQGF